MPPVKYTLESFEDVAGYPGKVFYVLHQYPGTGCPQVPFVAIDKTEEGFKIRELEQRPVEEFNDEKYKFHWPRDPRLQWARVQTPSVPLIQDVKSVGMEFFQKNKHTQGLTLSKDGHSMGQNGAIKDSSSDVTLESDPRMTVRNNPLSLPLSPRVFAKESPDNSIALVNKNASTSRVSLPVIVGDGVTSQKSGSSVSVGTQVDNSIDLVNQNTSASRSSLPVVGDSVASKKSGIAVFLDTNLNDLPNKSNGTVNLNASTSRSLLIRDSVASPESGSSVSVDSKTGDLPNKSISTINQDASTSTSSLPVIVGDSVVSKKSGNSVSVEIKVDDLPNKSINTVNQDASTSTSSLSVIVCDGVVSKKSGNSVSVEINVDDLPNKSTNTINQNASTLRTSVPDTVGDGVASKKSGSAVSEGRKECCQPSLSRSCTEDSGFKNTVPPSVQSTQELNEQTSGDLQKIIEHDTVSQSELCKRDANTACCGLALNVTPTDGKHPETISATSGASVAKMDTVPVISGQPKTTNEATPCSTVVRDISSIVNNILAEHVKSSNQTSESAIDPTITSTDLSELEMPSIQETSVETNAKKDPSPVKTGKTNETTFQETSHKTVVKEISSMVSVIISSHKLGNSQLDVNSYPRSSSSIEHEGNPKKSRELVEKRDKVQTDVEEKIVLKKGKELGCLPLIARKDLAAVDKLIFRAKHFNQQKRIQIIDLPIKETSKKEKPSKGNSRESGKTESKHELRKPILNRNSNPVQVERDKTVTSVRNIYDSVDKVPKETGDAVLRKKSSESSSKSSCSGNVSSYNVSQVRFDDSASDVTECSAERSTQIDSGPVQGSNDVYNFQPDDGEVPLKRKTIPKRRNTVDGSETRSRGRTKCVSKYAPYNLQKYRKELEKHRPTKKMKKPKTVETQNSGEKPEDLIGLTTAGSYSCPGSPVASPVLVASNAPSDKPSDALDNRGYKDTAVKKTEAKSRCKKSMKSEISKGGANTKDCGKNPVEVVQNSESSLSHYAELAPVKTPERDEDTKKKERKSKCLALMKERNMALETVCVGVDKGSSGTSIKSGTLEVEESSKNCPPTVGMHKLPAMVSSRSNQLKSVIPKKQRKTDGSDSGSNTSNDNVEMQRSDGCKTTGTKNPLEKTSDDKDLPKTPQLESEEPDQSELVGDEAMKKQKNECSESRKSPFIEIRKLQFALKRQKKLEFSPLPSPVKDTPSTNYSKPVALLDKKVTTSPTSDTALKVGLPNASTISDLPSDCPMYSGLPPSGKLLYDKAEEDAKKDKESFKSRLTENKDKTESPAGSSKLVVTRKGSVESPLENKHEKLKKKSSKSDECIKHVPSAVKVSAVAPKKSLVAAPLMTAAESSVEKVSTVHTNKPGTSAADKIAPIVGRSSDTVAVSNTSSNVPSLRTESPSYSTDLFPTTESRKQLLRQLTSTITESKLLSTVDSSKAHEKPSGLVSIGSNHLIEDKLKNLVEDIVKVKIEICENEMKKKNTSSLGPPTAEELGEFFSEIFDDIPPLEKDVTASEGSAAESRIVDKTLTAPVTPANNIDSMVPNPETNVPASDGKIESHGDAQEDCNLEAKLIESEKRQMTNDTPGKSSSSNTTKSPTVVTDTNASHDLIQSPVTESSTGSDKLASSKDSVARISSCLIDERSEVTPSLGSASPATAEQEETNNQNDDVSITEEVTQISSGCNSPALDDVFEISSQDSGAEIVDVDGISSTSLQMPRPVVMPKPFITLSSPQEGDDDVVITDVTSSTGESLLNAASNRDGSSNKRPPHKEYGQPKGKRLCAIPAPKLLPVRTCSASLGSSAATSQLPPILEPVMPQPFLEFRTSPTRGEPVTTTSSKEPETAPGPSQGSSMGSSCLPLPEEQTKLNKKPVGAPSTSQDDKGMKTQHEESMAQSIGRGSARGDVQDRPSSSSGNVEERSQCKKKQAGLLANPKSIPTRERSVLGGKGTQSILKQQHCPKRNRKRSLLNIISGKGGTAAEGKISEPEDSRQRRKTLLSTPRHVRERDFSESRQPVSLRLQGTSRPNQEVFRDTLIDRERLGRRSSNSIFDEVSRQYGERPRTLESAHNQKNRQGRPRGSSLAESSSRWPPFPRETPQEVLPYRADPHRNVGFSWERRSRIPSIFDVDLPRRRVVQEFDQDPEIIKTPAGRQIRRTRQGSSTERSTILSGEERRRWAPQEEDRRWSSPTTSQHVPQESQWPHQDRRFLTSRHDYNSYS